MSDSIRQDILHAEVHDTGVYLRDHIPVIYKFRWSLNCHKQLHNTHKVVKQYAWRWDKSNLDYYYHCTNNNINAVTIPDLRECDTNCSCVSYSVAINIYYENIVAALHSAAIEMPFNGNHSNA